MKSTREAFGNTISELSKTNSNLVVMTCDLKKATCVDTFADNNPSKFFQIGISEANMIGIASGLSEYGYRIFISSFASFLTGRYDIIRCSLAYSQSPVILVGTHAGMTIGRDGVTQMGLEDLSLMRSLPNMIVLNPATYSEAVSMVKYLCAIDLKSPCYLRLGRQPVEDVMLEYYQRHEYNFSEGIVIKEGKDTTIFSTGNILPEVIKVSERLLVDNNIQARVVNINCLKPIDSELIFKCSSESNVLFTVEDHSIIGGLGSAVSDVVCQSIESYPSRVVKIGLNDIFPESGKPEELYEKYGLSADKIYQRIISELCK